MQFKKRSIRWLYKACDTSTKNVAPELSTNELNYLAQQVVEMHRIDRQNRADWDRQMERALKLAKQVLEKKNVPFENASNVKHPLITVATIQFAARAYPEICKSGKVVKTQITGSDPKPAPATPMQAPAPGTLQPQPGAAAPTSPMPATAPNIPGPQGPPQAAGMQGVAVPAQPGPKRQRADRIEAHMNWQLTQEMTDWEADMDSLLHVLPVAGQCYKKTYFSGEMGHNISELVLPDDCVVSKGRSRDIKKARRVTHRLWVFNNDAVEKMRSGVWLDIPLGQAPSTDNDTDAPHKFLEQHCWFDLDGDGYKEPWIITVHEETARTVRVMPRFVPDNVIPRGGAEGGISRIEPDHYFTHYGFIPNPDGSMNTLGFGQLLEPINASVNTVLNQLLDSGKIYTAGGGFLGRAARIRGGVFTFSPGKWHMIDTPGGALKDNLIPNPTREPSAVMFQLLGFLVTMGKEISSVQDIFTEGKLTANIPVGTMMAFVEQGLKVYTAIYKRIYRSLSEELKKLYTLNGRFLEPRVSFQITGHEEQFTGQSDYKAGDATVMPVADPELSSDMQRMLKSQALREISGRPGLNEIEVTRRMVHALKPECPEEVLLSDDELSGKVPPRWKAPPPPQAILAQAKSMRLQQQAMEAQVRLQMDMAKFKFELDEIVEKIGNLKADTIKKLADADDKSRSDGMEALKYEANRLVKEAELKAQMLQTAMAQQMKPRKEGEAAPKPMPPMHPPQIGQPDMGPGPIPMQEGGPVMPGIPYTVGERGPELFVDELTDELERELM